MRPRKRGEAWAQGHRWGRPERGEARRAGWDYGAHPPRFALILDGLFGIGHGPFHEAHGLVHVVFDTVDHGSLSPDARGRGSAERDKDREERKSERRHPKWTLLLRQREGLTFRA